MPVPADAPPDPAAVTAPLGARAPDPLETTAVGADTPVPADSPPALVPDPAVRSAKRPVAIPRATRPTPAGLAGLETVGGAGVAPLGAAAAVGTSRPAVPAPGVTAAAPESVPQSKNPAFTSTIDGVAPVEASGPTIPVASSWMRPAPEGQSSGGLSGSEAEGSGAITFTSVAAGTPSAVPQGKFGEAKFGEGNFDEGNLTERNVAPGYADSGPVGFSESSSFSDGAAAGSYEGTRTAVEGPRITARLGVSSTAPRKRRTVVAALAAGIALVALGVAWPTLRRRGHQEGADTNQGINEDRHRGTTPVGSASEPAKATPTAPGAAAPLAAPPPPAEPVVATPPPASPAASAASIGIGEAPSQPGSVAAQGDAANQEGSSSASAAASSGNAKSRSRAARAEARLARAAARTKAKEKRREARAARKQAAAAVPDEARPALPVPQGAGQPRAIPTGYFL